MEKVKIKNFTDVITGGTPSTAKDEYWVNGNIPWLNSGELNQKIVTTSRNYITKLGLEKSSSRLMPNDTVLMALTGSTTGVVGYLTFEACANQSVTGILPSKKHNSKYLYHYLNHIRPKVVNDAYGGAQPHISQGYVKELEIPLPPIHTQQKIAAILDKADELRQYNKQLIEKYDALTQSLFLDMFGDPVRNEKGWEMKSLGEITNLITDGKHGNCNDEPGSGYYFISAKDIRNNKINYTNSREIPKLEFEEVDRRTNLQSGDLVMINTGATIGRMAIAKDIPETRKSTFQKSVAVIKVKKDVISSFFLQYVIELGLNTFANMGSGSAIKNLLLSEMRKFIIIVPTLSLQNQFAERIQLIETQKQQTQEALAKNEALFQGLLQQAFNGELN